MDKLQSNSEKRRSDPVYGWGPEKYHDAIQTTDGIQQDTHGAYKDVFGVTAGQCDPSTFALKTDGFLDKDEDDEGGNAHFVSPWKPSDKPNDGNPGLTVAV